MVDYSQYCSRHRKMKGIQSKFSSRCTFIWIGTGWEGFANQELKFSHQLKNKSQLLLEDSSTGGYGRAGLCRAAAHFVTTAKGVSFTTAEWMSLQRQLQGLTPLPAKELAWSLQKQVAHNLRRARSAKDSFAQMETWIFLTQHSVFIV